MTDDRGLSCAQLQEISAEIALGVLPADEQAAAMAHLERCPACGARVHELALTADALLELVPDSEPPTGFEGRVLERLGSTPARRATHRERWRRVALATAAAAAGLALGGGGWVLGSLSGRPVLAAPITSPAQPHVLTAQLTGGGHPMGQAFAYTGTSPWMYLSVDADGHSGTVQCRLQRADGSTVVLGAFTLDGDGYGHWGGPYPAGAAPVTGVRLLAANGSPLATATFVASQALPEHRQQPAVW
ncbi:hypothetical protein [Kitasatospora kifunensis]|uniref:Zinc-finger domain-containing protein n=1 Tax=Kitasatospora kifunensis TaxID=58351 RepID=A0A7W7VX93_KITKI|nr:hypothetical protein [Kitasatospora kifunensis]MBB4926352.1 hypothetical protein [Kitasatospora kifunensis]